MKDIVLSQPNKKGIYMDISESLLTLGAFILILFYCLRTPAIQTESKHLALKDSLEDEVIAKVSIPETSGMETISENFCSNSSVIFKTDEFNKKGVSRPQELVYTIGMRQEINVYDAFCMMGSENIKKKALTQSQIVAFCTEHLDLIVDSGRKTYFLLDLDGDLSLVGAALSDVSVAGMNIFIWHIPLPVPSEFIPTEDYQIVLPYRAPIVQEKLIFETLKQESL